MPNRIIREGILSSERVDKLTAEGEVFYRRMQSVVDDFGRFFAKPELVMSSAFPLRPGRYSPEQINAWLKETEDASLSVVYEHEGKRYLQLLDFRQQERAKASKFPAPPGSRSDCEALDEHLIGGRAADATQTHSKGKASAHLGGGGDVFGGGDVSVDEVGGVGSEPVETIARIPLIDGSEFRVSENDVSGWQNVYPAVDVRHQVLRIREWCISNPKKRKTARGVRGFITTWLGKEQDRGGPAGPGPRRVSAAESNAELKEQLRREREAQT